MAKAAKHSLTKKTRIGLDPNKSKALAEKLNLLLSNYQVFYINTRGFHWNISGEKFFELHVKFEQLYNDLATKIDEVAERIVTLGYPPIHSFSGYLKNSQIKEETNITEGKICVRMIVDSMQTILDSQREILHLSAELDDEGTNSLVSDYIREQEKLLWMYSAYLGA
ncbi:Dps family protein [Polluticoccus soli]|uniref:Dps family protein n=1 Tax=Polluticoccus soli TaxID=3034150 RepID=UPI0023E2CCAB|nr:Dps family protein [Flavipsychrobacter sp. JY13-12]